MNIAEILKGVAAANPDAQREFETLRAATDEVIRDIKGLHMDGPAKSAVEVAAELVAWHERFFPENRSLLAPEEGRRHLAGVIAQLREDMLLQMVPISARKMERGFYDCEKKSEGKRNRHGAGLSARCRGEERRAGCAARVGNYGFALPPANLRGAGDGAQGFRASTESLGRKAGRSAV
jgi:hypothetical protein